MLEEFLSFTLYSDLNLAIFGLWIASALFDYGELLYIAQLKEYRLDRFRDFMSTKQGRRFWFKYGRIMRVILAIVALLWPLNDIPTIKYILMALLILDITYTLYKGLQGKIQRPVLTPKILTIFVVSLFVEGLILVITRDWALAFLVLIIRMFILAFVVFLFSFPTSLIKKIIVHFAEKKLANYNKLKVIGITGSYGKSTVKEFTAQILSRKFKVIKTPKNINTEVGIAKFILMQDFSNTDIFVVEMGAYRIGEIKYICDMVHPQIGVLTGINEQHLSLFGSLENTKNAKYELLRALPKTGLAIINADGAYFEKFVQEIACPVQTYGSDEDNPPAALILDVQQERKNGTLMDVKIFGIDYRIKIPVIGKHNAWNFTAASLVAIHLGMTFEEIKQAAENIALPTKTLAEFEYGNCTVIDDSYNSNPDGFKSALEMLGSYPSTRNRVVITRGMLELGEKSEEIHEQIGGEIDFVADVLVIINEDYSEPLQRGVVGKYRTDVLLRYEENTLLNYVRSLKQTDSVILLENRIPHSVYKELTGLEN